MKLSIAERLVLLSLPSKGTIADIKLIREFKEGLAFDSEEQKAIKLVDNGQTLSWEGNYSKDIEVTPRAIEIVVETFDRLSRTGEFMEQHLPIYEKFKEAKDAKGKEGK